MRKWRSGTRMAARVPAGGVVLALAVGLVVTLAGAGMAFAADPAPGPAPTRNQAANQVPPDVIDKSNVAWDDHVQVLQLRYQCAAVTDQIRHKVQELRAAGTVIPDETRQAVKESRDAIRASREVLRDTVAQMRTELGALRKAREARDWATVLTHLETIIGIQKTRLEEGGHILSEFQNILAMLDSVG